MSKPHTVILSRPAGKHLGIVLAVLLLGLAGGNAALAQTYVPGKVIASGLGELAALTMAVDGDTLVAVELNGQAVVRYRNLGGADNWGQVAILAPTIAHRVYGVGVAISGDTIVVGAEDTDMPNGGMQGVGAAFVFKRHQGGADKWGETQVLFEPVNTFRDARFGHSVAINGNTLIVGARRGNRTRNGLSYTGAAYSYSRASANDDFAFVQQLLPTQCTRIAPQFGTDLALQGDTLVVADDICHFSGRVSIYERAGGAWNLQRELLPAAGSTGFATAIALHGDTLLVGAHRAEVDTVNSAGQVHVYERNLGGANNWGQRTLIREPLPEQNAFFGRRLALESGVALIGAPSDNSGNRVYVFRKDQGGADNWGMFQQLASSSFRHEVHPSMAVKAASLYHSDNIVEETTQSVVRVYVPFVPKLSVGDITQAEGSAGSRSLDVTVTLSQAVSQDVSFSFTTEDGSALSFNSSDYSMTSGAGTIAAGRTSTVIPVSVRGDTEDEPDESFTVRLSNPNNAALDKSAATITLTNDDGGPPLVTLSVSANTLEEAKAGTPDGSSFVSASLSKTSVDPVIVNLAISGDASTADYTLPSSITIPAGSTVASVKLEVLQDTQSEAHEQVTVRIASVTNATESGTQEIGVQIIDDEPPGVRLSATPLTVAEAGGTSTLTVTLTRTSGAVVTVNLAASGTSALRDFSLPASLTVAAGALTGTRTLTATQDDVHESNETVIVDVSSVTNAAEIGTQQVTVTITDDDPTPSVAFTAAAQSAGEAASALLIRADLSNPSDRDVSVPFSVSGSALAGADYSHSASPLVIPAGMTGVSITVTPIDDTRSEGDETAVFTLGAPVNAALGAITVNTLTLTDDDPLPSVAFAAASQSAGEAAGVVMIAVSLSAAADRTVSVPFTISGTATDGADYTRSQSPLLIPAGMTGVSLTVTITDDALSEGDETATFTLGAPSNATLGAIAANTLTITDNDAPAPTPTPAPTAMPTPGPTATPTPAPTAMPTPEPTPVVTPTPAPAPQPTLLPPAPQPEPQPQPTATPAPTPTPTSAPTATPVPSPTPAASESVQVTGADSNPVTVTTSSGNFTRATVVAAPAGAPAEFTYPAGFFAFDIDRLATGATTTVRITLAAGQSADAYIKCTPACAPFAGAVIEGNIITLTLVDGGAGDSDGIANGVIRDPGAPARRVTAVTSSSGGGGGGGAMGWLTLFGLLLLARRRQ